MTTLRWYLTIALYRALYGVGLHELAERWSRWSGLYLALRRAMWRDGVSVTGS